MTSSTLGAKPGGARRSTTIASIAERAGVSVPTVSKVINGRSDVAPETRRRVEAAIREHGYRRSNRATRAAPILELIFHELESEWALEIVRGVERVAGQQHLAVVLSEMQGRRTPGRGWIEGVLARRPTGVIAVFSDLSESVRTQLRTRNIPFVVVDPTGEPLHDTPSVGATNWNGGLTATRHLLGLGHRRIAVIGGPEDILCSRARIDGLPRRDGRGRRPGRSGADEPRSVPGRGGRPEGPRAPATAGSARRPSSPATTSRRSASTRPRARRGCTSPKTSAWSASTTCRSRDGSVRR